MQFKGSPAVVSRWKRWDGFRLVDGDAVAGAYAKATRKTSRESRRRTGKSAMIARAAGVFFSTQRRVRTRIDKDLREYGLVHSYQSKEAHREAVQP